MRPLKLRVRGFLGIKKGLGLDEVEVDLSNVTGLIALAGENGAGKSSFIELLTPYRSLYSRNGNINSHVFLRDAEKEFTFSYEGHTYRTLLKIDAESERGEGFIWKDGVPQVNGKRKEYDRYIEDLLGSQNLFASSVFCAQNSRKLTDMRAGELREMFAEFLRLDRLQAHEATAKQAIGLLRGMASQTDNRIVALKERTGKTANLEAKALVTTEDISRLETKRLGIEASMQAAKVEIEILKARTQENTGHRQRLKDIQSDMDALRRETSTLQTQEKEEIEALRQKYAVVKADQNKAKAVLANKELIERATTDETTLRVTITGLEAEVEQRQENLANEKTNLSNMEMIKLQQQQQKDALSKDVTLQEGGHEITLLRSQIHQAKSDLSALGSNRDLLTVEATITQYRDKMKDLGRKDPSCQSITCSFIVGALDAAKRLTVLEDRRQSTLAELQSKREGVEKTVSILHAGITVKESQLAARKREIEDLTTGITATLSVSDREIKQLKGIIVTAEEAISTLRQCTSRHRLELKRLAELAGKVSDIRVAAARLADTEKRLAEIAAQGATLRESWAKRICAKDQQLQQKDVLQRKTMAQIDDGAEEAVKKAQDALNAAEAALESVRKQREAQRLSLSEVHAELKAAVTAEKELEVVEREHTRLAQESSEWTYIRNACAATGLQALEIDGVVPHLQHDANRLLCMTFGPNYSIRIETQDDEGREVFRVMVIREDGDETALENLSGGQATWILKALRLSMTMLSKRKSGCNHACGFADEIDGGLDVENAKTFIAMYRAFMQEGAFESFYFISHKPECLSFADHVLYFRQGGIDIT